MEWLREWWCWLFHDQHWLMVDDDEGPDWVCDYCGREHWND